MLGSYTDRRLTSISFFTSFLPNYSMKKFTLGALSGISALAIGFPLVAQMSFAQSSEAAASAQANRPVPTQACVQAMANLESVKLSHFDTHQAEMKDKLEEHLTALQAAAALSDEDARKAALQAMHESMKAEKPEAPADVQAAQEALKTACGDTMKMKGQKGPGGQQGQRGPGGQGMRRGPGMGMGMGMQAPVQQ